MKDQYFADKRDFFKWDFLEDILDGCPKLKTFINISMLTPSDKTGQGNLKNYEPGKRRKPLHTFLQSCLKNGKRRVSEIGKYFQKKGRFKYYSYLDSYTYASREKYFKGIPKKELKQALVFFDPDIGLDIGTMKYMRQSGINKYLFDESLATVSRRASDNSVVVVYQHLQNNRNKRWNDIKERCVRFRNSAGAKRAVFLTDGTVAFLVTSKNPTTCLKASNIVVAHAHKHGLDCGDLADRAYLLTDAARRAIMTAP